MRFGVEYGGVRFPYRMTAEDPDEGNIQRVIQAGARLPENEAEHFPILISSEDIWHTAAVRGGLDDTAIYWCRYENALGQTWETRNPGDRSAKLDIQRVHSPKRLEERERKARAAMRAEGSVWEAQALEELRSRSLKTSARHRRTDRLYPRSLGPREEEALRLVEGRGEDFPPSPRSARPRQSGSPSLKRHGLVYIDRFDAPHARPGVAIERDARASWLRLMAAFDIPEEEPAEHGRTIRGRFSERTPHGRGRVARAKAADG